MADKFIVVRGVKVPDDSTKFSTTKFLRLIRDVQNGDVGKILDLFDYVFGHGKFDEVEAALADPETGETMLQDVMDWFNEAGEKVGAKN